MPRKLFLITATGLGFACPLAAQTLAEEEKAGDIVVTAIGAVQPSSDANVAISRKNEAEIQRQDTATLLDQIRTMPGVSISRNGAVGGFAGVRLRGAEAEQTRVLIDGVAVNDPSSPGGGFDFGTLLTSNVSSIEVLRGANSTVWGNQAIGGVVAIETLRANGPGFHAQSYGEYGTHDTRRASIGAAYQSDRVAFAMGGGYYDSDGISAAAVGDEPDGMRQYLGHGRLDLIVADPVTIELRGFYTHSRVDLDGFNFSSFALEDQPLYSVAQQANGYAGVKFFLADGRFANRLGYSIADINRDNYDPLTGNMPTFRARGRTETLAYKGDWLVAPSHRLLFGLERENNHLLTADAWSTVKARNNTEGVYAQWLFQPNNRFNMVIGSRHDHHSVYGGNNSLTANASYRIVPAVKVRGSYSEGFKAPTLFQLDGSAFGYGNPSLKPERARSFDIGMEASFVGGALIFRNSLFKRTTREQISYGSCPSLGAIPDVCENGSRPYGTYLNLSKTRASGMEMEIQARPVPDVLLSANYTLLNAKDISNASLTHGKRLARRPQHSAHGAIDYQHPVGWSVGADMSLVGDSFDDAGNVHRLEGYYLIGMRASLPIGKKFHVTARVENLTGETYQTAYEYGNLGRTISLGLRARY